MYLWCCLSDFTIKQNLKEGIAKKSNTLVCVKRNKMEIKILKNSTNDENTYFLIKDNFAIVIDPGVEVEKITDFSRNIKIEYIFLTHCHYDHIEDLSKLARVTGAKICATSECEKNLKDDNIILSMPWLGKKMSIEKVDIILNENEKFDFHGTDITVIKTPGHTSCSTCFKTGNVLFSGDTLFFESTGRWDLPTGNMEKIKKSITQKLYILDDDTNVYPGHGTKTIIGYEKKCNPIVNAN